MKQVSKTFCILPWMHIATSPSGNLRVCCNSTYGKNLILKSDGSPYKIYEDNLKEAWQAPVYKKIRRQMLKGEKPDICTLCFREESSGLDSPRINYNKKYMFDYEASETPPCHIKYLDLRLGNKCNLRCRMCNPYTSNSLFKEWDEISTKNISSLVQPLSGQEKKKFKNLLWPKSFDFSKIFEHIQYIEEIYLTGGEPLLIKEQYDFLEYIVHKGFAKNIELKYSTNLTKYDSEAIQLWKHFKKIHLNISVDAYGKLNNYIRYPAKWNQLENNLRKMISLREKKSFPLIVQIVCTVQMYNITSIRDFFWWIKKQNLELQFNILDYPKFLNIRVLPDVLKKKVEKELLHFQEDFPIEKIINYMNKENWGDLLSDFFRWSDFLDRSRNQNLKEVLPELSSFRKV